MADPALYSLRRPNTVDGSFSTNFFQVDMGLRFGRLDDNDRMARQVSLRLKGEWHPVDFLKGGLSSVLAEEYGGNLLGVAVEGERFFRHGIGRMEVLNQWRFGNGLGLMWDPGRLDQFQLTNQGQ